MGICRHLKNKEQSNYLPSVRETSCRLVTGRRLVNSIVAFYGRPGSLLPERVC